MRLPGYDWMRLPGWDDTKLSGQDEMGWGERWMTSQDKMMRKGLRKMYVKITGHQCCDGCLLRKYQIHQQLRILLMRTGWVAMLWGLLSVGQNCDGGPHVWVSE